MNLKPANFKLLVALSAFLVGGLLLVWFFSYSLHYDDNAAKYRLAAQFYVDHGLRGNLFTSRFAKLYPLLIAPFFAMFDVQTAIQLARALNVVFFLSTVIPFVLSARLILSSRLYIWLAALGGVCTPWVVLSGSVVAEPFAFFFYGWAMYFIFRAVLDCRWYFDFGAISMVLLCGFTKPELFVLAPVYFLTASFFALRRVRFRLPSKSFMVKTVAFLREFWITYPAATLVFTAFFAGKLLSGNHLKIDEMFSSYQVIKGSRQLPPNILSGLSVEIVALAFGVGLSSALLGCAWYVSVLSQRNYGQRKNLFAFIVVFSTASIFVSGLIGQGGYIGPATEETSYFYVVPFLWLGAFAVLETKDRRAFLTPTLIAGVIVSASAGLIDLATVPTAQSLVRAPSASLLQYFTPQASSLMARLAGYEGGLFSTKDALAYLSLLILILTAFALHRSGRMTAVAIACSATIQLGVVGLMLLAYSGHFKGIKANTGTYQKIDSLGWVDRSLLRDKKAFWLLNQTSGSDEQQIKTFFWNKQIFAGIYSSAFTPLSFSTAVLTGLPKFDVQPDKIGILAKSQPEFVVQRSDSSYFQIATKRVLRSAESDGLELAEVDQPVKLTWTTKGLDATGSVSPTVSTKFTVPDAGKDHPVVVTMAFTNTSPTPMTFSVELAAVKKQVQLAPSVPQKVTFVACTDQPGNIQTIVPGSFQPVPDQPAQSIGPKLDSVHLRRTKGRCKP